MERLLECFRHRRVGVHVAGEFLGGQIPLVGQRHLREHLGDVVAHKVPAEEFVGVGVGDELGESGCLAESLGLAVGAERESGGLDVVTLVLGLRLGEPEGRDLRLAEGGPRHEPVVAQGHGFGAGHGLGGHDALRLGHVGELQFGGDVADGVDALDVGAHEVVDRDGAAVGQLDACVLQAEALDSRREADGHEDLVDGEFAVVVLGVLVGDGHAVAVVGDRLHLGGRHHLDAELLVLLGDGLGGVGVLVGQDAVEELDDRHVDAVVGQDVTELHADGPGADDHDGFGQLTGEDLGLVGDHVVGELDAGQQFHRGTGVDDDVVEGDLPIPHDDGFRVLELPVSVDLGDLVLLHQEVDTLDDALADLATAIERSTEVEGHLAGDPEGLGLMVEDVREFRVSQQRLGRDTSDVETHTAPVLLFDDGGFHAQLSRPDRGDVPTWTCTQYNCLKVFSHDCQPTSRRDIAAGCPATQE